MTTAAVAPAPPEYVVAHPSPPPIKCPAWCAVSYEEHVADLRGWEGFVIHWSKDITGEGWELRYSTDAYPDGTINPTDPPQVSVVITDELLHPHDAEKLALALQEAVKELRA